MQDKKKFYEVKWFLWLFLILFPPIGIILLWVVHKDMKKNKKIILSVIFVIWFIILVVAMNGDNSTTENKVDKQQEITEVETSSAEIAQSEVSRNLTNDFNSETNLKSKFKNCTYEIPKNWTEKNSKDEIRYYYPKNGLLTVMYQQTEGSIQDAPRQDEFIEGFVSGMDECVSKSDKEEVDIDGQKGLRFTLKGTLTDIELSMDIVCFDVEDGILAFMMSWRSDTKDDYSIDFEKVLNSIKIFNTETTSVIEKTKPKKHGKKSSKSKKSTKQKTKEFTNEEIEGKVKKAIKGDMGEDESYAVVFRDGYLFVCVDFSKVDPTPLTFEDLAITRTSSITDTILDLTDIYNLWDEITVSFGVDGEEIGDITNTKDDVEKNEFGGRYFPQENFALE